MNEKDKKALRDGVSVATILLSIPLGVLSQGWAIATLWGWILVPLGVPPVGLVRGWAIAALVGLLLIGMARREDCASNKDSNTQAFEVFGRYVLLPPFVVCTVWVIMTLGGEL